MSISPTTCFNDPHMDEEKPNIQHYVKIVQKQLKKMGSRIECLEKKAEESCGQMKQMESHIECLEKKLEESSIEMKQMEGYI